MQRGVSKTINAMVYLRLNSLKMKLFTGNVSDLKDCKRVFWTVGIFFYLLFKKCTERILKRDGIPFISLKKGCCQFVKIKPLERFLLERLKDIFSLKSILATISK